MTRPRCPTCGAAFRGGPACGRCGADLRGLAAVLLAARREREEARRLLAGGGGDAVAEEALDHARRSRDLDDVPGGRRLHVLAFLAAGRIREGVRLLEAVVGEEEAGG